MAYDFSNFNFFQVGWARREPQAAVRPSIPNLGWFHHLKYSFPVNFQGEKVTMRKFKTMIQRVVAASLRGVAAVAAVEEDEEARERQHGRLVRLADQVGTVGAVWLRHRGG